MRNRDPVAPFRDRWNGDLTIFGTASCRPRCGSVCDISYSAVRGGFQKSEILRCGSVRFSNIGKATVRFGADLETRKSNGAVRLVLKSYGAVLCGFPGGKTLRCGAVRFSRRRQKPYGAVRCGFPGGKNPTVRCGAVNRTGPDRTDRKNRSVKNPAI